MKFFVVVCDCVRAVSCESRQHIHEWRMFVRLFLCNSGGVTLNTRLRLSLVGVFILVFMRSESNSEVSECQTFFCVCF